VALVRARTLSEVAKTIAGGGDVTLSLGAHTDAGQGAGGQSASAQGGGGRDLVGFSAGGRQMTSLLVQGEYPKVRALFPAESTANAVVSTGALIEAVKRAALVAERNTPVRLTFAGDHVLLRAGAGDEAQATEEIEGAVEGDAVEIAFNPTYLLDGLGAVAAPNTRLSFTSATRPAVLTGEGDGSGAAAAYRYLLMPVRLSG
jgi:DNA polymerase-3 subunit beta